MSKDHAIMVLIRSKRENCVFTTQELVSWLMEDQGITIGAAYRLVKRLLTRLPVEILSSKFYRLLVVPELSGEKPKQTKKLAKNDTSSIAREVLDYLNQKTGKRYSGKAADILKIKARMAPPENHTLEDFKTVIDKKCAEWIGGNMEKFLRPETLFGTKFESYLNQSGELKEKSKAEKVASYDFSKYLNEGN
jgi:uncharacterized phage protein (TIGR02220 family)